MSLQAILNDVEACVRASAAHSAGTPEENAAMALLNDLAKLLAARQAQQKSAAKASEKVFDTAKPLKGKPSAMIELLEEPPKAEPQPVVFEVKDLSSQVAGSRKPRVRMPGDYDPDSPMLVPAARAERRISR